MPKQCITDPQRCMGQEGYNFSKPHHCLDSFKHVYIRRQYSD